MAPALRLPLGPLRRLNDSDWEGARSCNLAVWRSDLDRVDGFDAAFSGWGLEDSDLIVRLIHSGIRRKDGRFATGVLHLWHPESDRATLPDNRQRLDAVIGSERVRALQGLSALALQENDEAVRLVSS
ncbi:MAG: galactosyltransferase-related protein [Xanthobacteraceae bacterium]